MSTTLDVFYSRNRHQHAKGFVSHHDPFANSSIHLAGQAPKFKSVVVVPQVQAPLQSTGLSSDDMQVMLHHRLYDVK